MSSINSSKMAVHQLRQKLQLKASPEEIWQFISAPENLKEITPAYMGFDITSEVPSSMYPGLIISYKVKPLLNIPMTWVTEITQVKDGEYFVDEQRQGPYKMWHHEHHIKAIEGGVQMDDIVSYIPPFSFIGQWTNSWLIRPRLEAIFEFRKKVLIERFGEL